MFYPLTTEACYHIAFIMPIRGTEILQASRAFIKNWEVCFHKELGTWFSSAVVNGFYCR